MCSSEEISPDGLVGNDLDSRYSILEDGTLMIENTRDSDQGAYECVARNHLGETKANAVQLRYLDGDSNIRAGEQ